MNLVSTEKGDCLQVTSHVRYESCNKGT